MGHAGAMSRPQEPTSPPDREPLSGLVERVSFHNPDSGFCVLRVRVKGQRELVAVVGSVPAISAGETIQCSGQWNNSQQYGLQFKARHMTVAPPSSLEGIEKYLGSGMIHGIGPHFAAKLVKAFGEQVFDIIENQPDKLTSLPGIGAKRVQQIQTAWNEQKAVRDIMVFLQSHGMGSARAARIYRRYGADAIPLISDNPYRLARDIRGIGFATADGVAGSLGIAPTAMIRAQAGLAHVLDQATGEGHCCLPVDEMLEQAGRLLEIPDDILQEALRLEIMEGHLVDDRVEGRDCVFLTSLWSAETTIAERFRALTGVAPHWAGIDPDKAIPWAESRLGIGFAESQRAAVTQALRAKVMVITGGPGVGKTTLVNGILTILAAKKLRIGLAAPTGRAARRLSESTGREAKTLHRLLEVDPRQGGFKRDEEWPLELDLLVVDEVSMVDLPLMAALLRALPDEAGLLLVGDVDQLPSVGPGQVLADLIGSGVLPVARLTEIFRQAAASSIVTNAHRINQGMMPVLEPDDTGQEDFFFVPAHDATDAHDKVMEIVGTRLHRRFGLDPRRDVQVLCPMNRGGLGARSMNVDLQNSLNPDDGGPWVERFGTTFRAGDKVMQVANDYDKEVFNGDTGLVRAVDPETARMTVDFDGRDVTYGFDDLDSLTLAYAITIHKSQGSEYPAVVIPVMMQHFVMLERNLLYTGLTRGRRLVVLVGESRAIAVAVKERPGRRRWSKLARRLRDSLESRNND